MPGRPDKAIDLKVELRINDASSGLVPGQEGRRAIVIGMACMVQGFVHQQDEMAQTFTDSSEAVLRPPKECLIVLRIDAVHLFHSLLSFGTSPVFQIEILVNGFTQLSVI